jgi:hypothetical protein
MSYDITVWSTDPTVLPACLPRATEWHGERGTWVSENRSWQIVVGPSDRVLAEDVPDDVARMLPGIAFRTELNLSPIDAGLSAKRFLERAAIAIAKASHGVVFDPQTDTCTSPRGLRRFVSLGSEDDASLLTLTWWFVDGPLADGEDFGGLVDVLASRLPEALPRRYGLYEPPQHIYAETGRAHFLSFLRDEVRNFVVWSPHAPVARVHLGIPDKIGGSRFGFRSARFEIQIDVEMLAQPGWARVLRDAWREISHTVRPIYGDVRTLSGYKRNRGRYSIGQQTENHPVCSWWWAGIPRGPVHAAVVGEPYLALWPGLRTTADVNRGLAFVSADDWTLPQNAFDGSGEPPDEIAQHAPEFWSPNSQRTYPAVWPFEAPLTQ